MLKDLANKYYSKEYDFNCAEAVLYACDEYYNLNLDKKTFKTMAGFGGGVAVESICGAISGGVAVIGILFVDQKSHESDKIKSLTYNFVKDVEDELGTSNCKELKDKYRDDVLRCEIVVQKIAQILEDTIDSQK